MARLPVYLRALNTLADGGTTTCSSEELAGAAGVNSAKLRKDLSHLGSYGTRGVGYDVEYLRYQIAREIGLTQDWPVVIVGIGNLGHALANYSGFSSRGFRIVALLDADPARTGQVVGRPEDPRLRRARRDRARARRRDRRDRHPRRRRAGRLRPDGRGRRQQHPQLRPDRARRPRRGRRAQGRPLHRAADPRLPRAAQGGAARGRGRMEPPQSCSLADCHSTRPPLRSAPRTEASAGAPDERPRGGHLPQQRPGGVLERLALDARGGDQARPRRRRPASTCPRRPCSRPATGSRSTPTSRASTAASRRSRGCCASSAGEDPEEFLPHLYVHYDDGAVSHLFHVASGLDSMVVGESQILGQVREALRVGQEQRHRRPGAQPALPAGAAGRQALPRRDRHRPLRALARHRVADTRRRRTSATSPASACSSSAPARWPRSPSPPPPAPAPTWSSPTARARARRPAGRRSTARAPST